MWAVLLGLGVSTFPLTLTLIGTRTRTTVEAGRLSGVVQGVGYGIGCVGPVVLGVLRQASGTWAVPTVVLLITLAFTIGSGWFACQPLNALSASVE